MRWVALIRLWMVEPLLIGLMKGKVHRHAGRGTPGPAAPRADLADLNYLHRRSKAKSQQI